MAPNDGPSIWRESFSDESRKEQVEDDSAAWHAVTGLLLWQFFVAARFWRITVTEADS